MNGGCAEQPKALTLIDGSVTSVRRLDVNDIDALIALYERLTDRERYFRFFTIHPTSLETLAVKLTEQNSDHCALGCFDAGRLIGMASYQKSREPGVAEVSVAVAHGEHLRGIGTALLTRLGQIARHNGIHRFVADILVDNHPMMKVISPPSPLSSCQAACAAVGRARLRCRRSRRAAPSRFQMSRPRAGPGIPWCRR